MSAPPETPRKKSSHRGAKEKSQDSSEDLERLIVERTAQLQTQIESLQRENADLKEAEATLRRDTEQYRLLVENSQDVMYLVTPQGIITFVSPQVTRFGYLPEEVISEPFLDFVSPEFRQHVLEMFQNALNSGAMFPTEFQIQRKDGLCYWVEALGKTLYDDTGQPLLQVGIMRDITCRKQAEEALRESERKYRQLVELLHEGIMVLDRDARITFVNPRMVEMSGYSLDEIIGHSIFSFTDNENREIIQHNILRRKQGLRDSYELCMLKKDGSRLYVTVQVTPLMDGRGDYAGSLASVADITERKKMEEALRKSEENLHAFMFALSQSAHLIDTDGTVLASNEVSPKRLGISLQEYVGTNIFTHLPPDVAANRKNYLDRAVNEKTPISWEDTRQNRPYEHYLFPVIEKDGSINRVAHIALDITERKQMEDALRESLETERVLLSSPTDMALLLDVNGTILNVNDSYAKVLGRYSQNLIGACIWDLMPPEVVVYRRKYFDQAVQSKKTVRFEEIRNNKWYDSIVNPILSNRGMVVRIAIIARDVTERKRVEEALKKYSENLKQSNEDLERFAYVSSHDLQEPLRAIVSYTQLLERRYKDKLDSDVDEYLHYIVDGGKRMQALIQDMLEFSRVTTEEHKFSTTDSEAVLNNTLTNLQVRMERCQATITHDPLPMVMADANQLQQVFQNLIGNAIKFQKEGVPAKIHVSAKEKDGMVQFSVTDNGIGIDREYFQKIFVIFQRLHNRDHYDGTGIGLALCKRTIERHGGRIWVESEPGEGSTFYFTLQAVKSQS